MNKARSLLYQFSVYLFIVSTAVNARNLDRNQASSLNIIFLYDLGNDSKTSTHGLRLLFFLVLGRRSERITHLGDIQTALLIYNSFNNSRSGRLLE